MLIAWLKAGTEMSVNKSQWWSSTCKVRLQGDVTRGVRVSQLVVMATFYFVHESTSDPMALLHEHFRLYFPMQALCD